MFYQYPKELSDLSLIGLSSPERTVITNPQLSHSSLHSEWHEVGIGLAEQPLIMTPRRLYVTNDPKDRLLDTTFSLSAFSGLTPDYSGPQFPHKYYEYLNKYQRLHVGHPEAKELMDTYYDWTRILSGISGLDENLRAVGPNSTEAIREAIMIAYDYQIMLQSSYRGVVCSAGSHQAVRSADSKNTYIVPLNPRSGQMDEECLIKTIEEKRPAILVLTLGRTDDGEIEGLSNNILSTLARHPNILVLYDATLNTPVPLYPDSQIWSDTDFHLQKAKLNEAINFSGHSIFIINPSKHYGIFNLSQLRFRNITDPLLENIIKLRLRIPQRGDCEHSEATYDYVAGHGYFGTTTISALPAFQAVETIRNLGPWYLRLLVLNSVRLALDFSKLLRSLKIDANIQPVRLNACSIKLNSKEEAINTRKILRDRYGINIAKCQDVFPGIRIVFDLGCAFTPSTLDNLCYAIYNSLNIARGNSRDLIQFKDLNDFSRKEYFFDRRHITSAKQYFSNCNEPLPIKLQPKRDTNSNERSIQMKMPLIEALGSASERFDINTRALGEAINALAIAVNEPFFSRGLPLYRAADCLKWAIRAELKIRKKDQPEVKLWKNILLNIAAEATTLKQKLRFAGKERRLKFYENFMHSAVSNTSKLTHATLNDLRPIAIFPPGWGSV